MREGPNWKWIGNVHPGSLLRADASYFIFQSGPTPAVVNNTFRLVAQTQQEEDAFDYVQHRTGVKFTGVVGSVAHMVKGALGAGILGSHVAYMKAGVYVAVPLNVAFGMYMGVCLYLLVHSAQILYRRTRIPSMSYSDVGEAAVSCFPNPKVARFSKHFRYLIDSLIILDLFGACACYQIIIAKSIKQLVENTHETSMNGLSDGYPGLRIYMLAIILPIVCICLIKHLKWLAPFSILANIIILFCIFMTIYYAILLNPTFSNMKPYGKLNNFFEFTGMAVFGMSCSGVVLPVENNMRNPKRFRLALGIAMTLIIMCMFCIAFFGYAAFLEKCDSPITVNFPMTIVPKILKGLIAVMIFVTHAVNFWVPFNLCFHYIKKCHKKRLLMWELIYRALFVLLIASVAIAFPSINALMGFFGAFCLTNMAFIWPTIINLLVIWHRPGLGKYKWRLWRAIIFLIIGIFVFACGTFVNGRALLSLIF